MKVLLKSQDMTATIIVSLSFRRQYWIDFMNDVKRNPNGNDHDKKMVIEDCQRIIDECNGVLDAIGAEN